MPEIAVADMHEGAVPPPAEPFSAEPWQRAQAVARLPAVAWLVVLAMLPGVPTRPVSQGVGCAVFARWQFSQPFARLVLATLNLGLTPLAGVA